MRTANDLDDTLHLSYALSPTPALTEEGSWTQVFAGGAVTATNFTETIVINGVSDTVFGLMFWTNETTNDEGFTIREISVSGNEISIVPLPAALPLMLFGLGALAVAQRRRPRG